MATTFGKVFRIYSVNDRKLGLDKDSNSSGCDSLAILSSTGFPIISGNLGELKSQEIAILNRTRRNIIQNNNKKQF